MNFRRIIQRAAELAAIRARTCAIEGDELGAADFETAFRRIYRWRLHRQRIPDVLELLFAQPLADLYRQRDAVLSHRADLRLQLIRARVAGDQVGEARLRAQLTATDQPLQVLRWDIDQQEKHQAEVAHAG